MLTVTTPATVEPVTLAEAKAHLRLIHTDDDAMVSGLISAAREAVELRTGLALAAAGYLWAPPRFGGALPLWPATVTAVTQWDGSARVPVTDSRVDEARGRLVLGDYCEAQVAFTADPPASIPAALKASILLIVGELYENAEAATEKALADNPALDRLCWPYRRNLGV